MNCLFSRSAAPLAEGRTLTAPSTPSSMPPQLAPTCWLDSVSSGIVQCSPAQMQVKLVRSRMLIKYLAGIESICAVSACLSIVVVSREHTRCDHQGARVTDPQLNRTVAIRVHESGRDRLDALLNSMLQHSLRPSASNAGAAMMNASGRRNKCSSSRVATSCSSPFLPFQFPS